jgi:hypothetical protein
MAKGFRSIASSSAKAFTMLVISLIIIWFLLNWLHQRFSGNAVGSAAGTIGSLATGQKYNF